MFAEKLSGERNSPNVPVSVEALEDRIAPASFVFDGGGKVVDSRGAEVGQYDDGGSPDWFAKMEQTGAESAYLFKAGDSLGFDANGNGKLDKGEEVLLSLKGGAAVVFLGEVDPEAGTAEILGMSAGGKLGGTINGVVGSIVGNLVMQGKGKAATYGFTGAVQGVEVSGLTINGYVEGDITVGGNISKLIVNGADAVTRASLQGIFAGETGTGASNPHIGGLSFWDYEVAEGANGASINKVMLAGGGEIFSAGKGGSSDGKKAGNGGSVSDLVMQAGILGGDNLRYSISAGWGGSTDAGKAGNGGSIGKIAVFDLQGGDFTIEAGAGGEGGAGAGKGGSISELIFVGTSLDALSLVAGDGGDESSFEGAVAGGAGGSIAEVFSDLDYIGGVGIQAGNGGTGSEGRGGNGGDGGKVFHVQFDKDIQLESTQIVTSNLIGGISARGGNGGDGQGSGSGGAGGAITSFFAPTIDGAEILSGFGGSAEVLNFEKGVKLGKSGAGGNIHDIGLVVQQIDGETSGAGIYVAAGSAGGYGQKAPGGSVSQVFVQSLGRTINELYLFGGAGSTGLNGGGHAGGNGGDISKAVILASRVETAFILAGPGGHGAFAPPPKNILSLPGDYGSAVKGGAGGAGGDIELLFFLTEESEFVQLLGGDGGEGAANGAGGAGGSVNEAILSGMIDGGDQYPGTFARVEIFGGNGGAVYAPNEDVNAKGGNGGSLNKVFGPEFNTYLERYINVGAGGEGTQGNLNGMPGKWGIVSVG